MPADVWKPGVVAHRETDAADVGDSDGNEAVSGGGRLVGAPGEDLAVGASEPAVGEKISAVLKISPKPVLS